MSQEKEPVFVDEVDRVVEFEETSKPQDSKSTPIFTDEVDRVLELPAASESKNSAGNGIASNPLLVDLVDSVVEFTDSSVPAPDMGVAAKA